MKLLITPIESHSSAATLEEAFVIFVVTICAIAIVITSLGYMIVGKTESDGKISRGLSMLIRSALFLLNMQFVIIIFKVLMNLLQK